MRGVHPPQKRQGPPPRRVPQGESPLQPPTAPPRSTYPYSTHPASGHPSNTTFLSRRPLPQHLSISSLTLYSPLLPHPYSLTHCHRTSRLRTPAMCRDSTTSLTLTTLTLPPSPLLPPLLDVQRLHHLPRQRRRLALVAPGACRARLCLRPAQAPSWDAMPSRHLHTPTGECECTHHGKHGKRGKSWR